MTSPRIEPFGSAEWFAAEVCARHAIPVVFVDAAGLERGERGITTHAEVSRAFHLSTHWDPGPGFPIAAFVEAVRDAMT